jgi:hypothetical protein
MFEHHLAVARAPSSSTPSSLPSSCTNVALGLDSAALTPTLPSGPKSPNSSIRGSCSVRLDLILLFLFSTPSNHSSTALLFLADKQSPAGEVGSGGFGSGRRLLSPGPPHQEDRVLVERTESIHPLKVFFSPSLMPFALWDSASLQRVWHLPLI